MKEKIKVAPTDGMEILADSELEKLVNSENADVAKVAQDILRKRNSCRQYLGIAKVCGMRAEDTDYYGSAEMSNR